MIRALIVLAVLVVTTAPAPQPSPVHKLEELTWPRIAAFARDRTLFILPVGVLEAHGPHLPIAADTLGIMYEANRTAERVSRALPGWNVVKITTAPGWQGYLSSPAKATAAYGRAIEAWWIQGFTELMLRAVKGENMRSHRDPGRVPPPVAPVLEKALANEAAFEAKLDAWLAERRRGTPAGPHAAQTRTCEALASMPFPQATITAAAPVSAGTFTPPGPSRGNAPPSAGAMRDLPAFCRVAATLKPSADSDIKVEVWMPVAGWNGKFMGVGNGGWAGSISYGQMRDPLRRGYAVASTDTGHSGNGFDGSFALGRPEKLVDFGYRAVHEMTLTSKVIVRAFYGQAPRFSYWFGGSTGGKQGLTEAQRYPDDYDGIIAGAPVNYWSRVMSHLIWIARATHDDPAAFIPPDKFPTIYKAVVERCDADDGVRDTLVSDPKGCRFDPGVLLCSGADAVSCLTAPQVQAAKKIYGPALSARTGRVISPGLLPGSEIAWQPAAASAGPFRIVDDYFKYVVFKNADWDYRTLDFDTGVKLAHEIGDAVLNATDPDLSKFEQRGGKLLLFHGWSDELISPLNTIEYYEAVVTAMGAGRTDGFLRLFMVPGMGHGLGAGPGPNTFDMVEALEQWVEKGIAPVRVLASHRTSGRVDRTRPLCPYPQVAVYNGTGDSDDAASFACKKR